MFIKYNTVNDMFNIIPVIRQLGVARPERELHMLCCGSEFLSCLFLSCSIYLFPVPIQFLCEQFLLVNLLPVRLPHSKIY